MAKYWSASSASIWDSAICDTSAMPSDKVAITDTEYTDLMAKQAQGYKIVNNTSTGKPQAIAQGLTNATRTVQALDSEVVHKTGAETVAGVKTFTDSPKVERVNPYVDIVQTDIKKGTAPSATSYAGVRFGGSEGAADDDKQMGALLHNYYSNGANIMRLQVSKPAAGSTETASLTVAYSGAGDAYASAPTPVNEDDNSTKVATTEWVKKKADKYLPLAGGTMSGGITFDSADVGSVFSDGKDLCLGRANGGSLLRLRGQDTDDNAGGFQIRAVDSVGTSRYLVGYSDGRLTWNAKDVITSDGGEMDGQIKAKIEGVLVGATDSSAVRVSGGTGWDNGGSVISYGKSHASYPGIVRLKATDGTNTKELTLKPDGTLTWGGKNVTLSGDCLPRAGGTMEGTINFKNNTEQKIYVDDHGDVLVGGSGSLFRLRGLESESNPGGFQVRAGDGTTNHYLIGYPDGGLSWSGKNVERVNAIGSDYIRYESGIQIVWGSVKEATTATFPVAFSSDPIAVTTHKMGSTGGAVCEVGAYVTKTTIYVKDNTDSSNNYNYYIVIGRWK